MLFNRFFRFIRSQQQCTDTHTNPPPKCNSFSKSKQSEDERRDKTKTLATCRKRPWAICLSVFFSARFCPKVTIKFQQINRIFFIPHQLCGGYENACVRVRLFVRTRRGKSMETWFACLAQRNRKSVIFYISFLLPTNIVLCIDGAVRIEMMRSPQTASRNYQNYTRKRNE